MHVVQHTHVKYCLTTQRAISNLNKTIYWLALIAEKNVESFVGLYKIVIKIDEY